MRKYSLIVFFTSVLVATVFFDDPHLYFYKRIVYVIFMFLSLWQIYLFNYKRPDRNEDLPMPSWYRPFINILAIFTLIALYKDIRNPGFSLITMLNHPLAALVIVPLLAFKIGYQTRDIDKFIKFLLITGILFCLLFIFPIQGRNIYAQGVACCYAVLPLTIFALDRKKYRVFAFALIILSFLFSQASESRTIILRIMLFLGLLVGMNFFRKWAPLKFIVMTVTGFFIFQFLTNLETWLELFKSFIHVRNFDDEDTRTFLYEEVFGDMKAHELFLGRGFQGTYFSPYFLWIQTNNHDFTGDNYNRFSVEVGFLQLLLKGGFVFLLLYITPLVTTVYRGLFKRNKSNIAFSISVYILCELFVLFIENIPAYHFQFFIMFFLAGYAYRQTVPEQSPVHENIYNNALLQPGAVY